MTAAKTLQAELERLGEIKGAPHALRFTEDGKQIELQLVELNSLACAFGVLSVADSSLSTAAMPQLQQVSEKLCSRLNYLLEPIRPIEIDTEQCLVQMRSNPPSVEDDQTSYYELLVRKPGLITLQRYSKQPGEARVCVPAEVTRAVLGRLVEDFCRARELLS